MRTLFAPALIWPEWVPLFHHSGEAWGLLDLAVGMASYAVLYAGCAGLFLLSGEERTRILRAVRGSRQAANGESKSGGRE